MVDVARVDEEDPAVRSERWHVRIRGLHKAFGDHEVLRGMDLDLERNKMNVIVGGSGSGKSVLLKHVIGLLRPTAGHVWFDGLEVDTVPKAERRTFLRRLGFLFQATALFDSLSVEDNLAFPLLEYTKLTREEIRSRSHDMLARLDLTGAERKLPGELSGGMRKRAALARALMLEPEIMLYDEPTTGLDPLATENVDELLVETGRSRGVTSVVISHDMSSVFRIADRIAVIRDGRIEAAGTPDEIRAHDSAYVREFLTLSGVRAARPLHRAA